MVSVNGEPILEHRHVMETVLGRRLTEFENVHHKNGDKLNNDVSNLELWVTKQPKGQRVADLVEFVVSNYRAQVMERLKL